MHPIEDLTPKQIKDAITSYSLNLSSEPLSPAEHAYLQSLIDADRFGVEQAQAMAKDRALAKRANFRVVRTPEQIAQHNETSRMAKLALVPEIQNVLSERDRAVAQTGLAHSLDKVEIAGLNTMVAGLKAANGALEKEVERLRRTIASLKIEMSYNQPVVSIAPVKMGFLAKLKDLFLNT